MKVMLYIIELVVSFAAIFLMLEWGLNIWQVLGIVVLFSIDAVMYRHRKMLD